MSEKMKRETLEAAFEAWSLETHGRMLNPRSASPHIWRGFLAGAEYGFLAGVEASAEVAKEEEHALAAEDDDQPAFDEGAEWCAGRIAAKIASLIPSQPSSGNQDNA